MPAHCSRRNFLQTAASAAFAAPMIIPSSALGNEEKAPPSERVTIGHIGVGGRGRAIFRGVQQCREAQSVAVSDCFANRREPLAKIVGGTPYADFQELLAKDDIDAVVVATPDHWHVPIANAAARAGKGAYVEKPLGVSLDQDIACQKLFAEKKLVFQYGTQQRSMKHCHLGCELVRRGRLGEIQRIEVTAPDGGAGGSTEEVPVPSGFDYERWLGPAPKAPYTASRCRPPGTYWIYDYSIGYLAGWGAHPLDILVWADDSDLAGPYTVSGKGVIPEQGLYDCVINWHCEFKMANGVTIDFKPGADSTKFIGSKGWIDVRRRGTTAEPASLLEEDLSKESVQLAQSSHHQRNFVEAVKAGGQAVSTIKDAVRSNAMSLLCDIAVRTGSSVTWDPATSTLTGPEEAKKMMHRPLREPWTL